MKAPAHRESKLVLHNNSLIRYLQYLNLSVIFEVSYNRFSDNRKNTYGMYNSRILSQSLREKHKYIAMAKELSILDLSKKKAIYEGDDYLLF